MAKGYWLVSIDIKDADAYGEYVKRVRPYLERCNAQFLTRGGTHEVREGNFRTRNVVIEFSTYQHALDCYNAEEYIEIKALRENASDGDLVIVEGL